MSADEVDDQSSKLFANPMPALMTGVLASFAGYVVSWFGHSGVTVLPLLVALVATGIAVAIAPKTWWVLGSAAVVALLAMLTADQSNWDPSLSLLFWLVAIVAGLSAFVVTLSSGAQRVVVSLVILFHFGGIATAVTSASPQSWVSSWLWSHVYRPYLQFMYLNNAYHFYSPEPGPATLVWFRIEYEPDPDGTTYSRWVKIPDVNDDGRAIDDGPAGQERRIPNLTYTRRLSMAEMANAKADFIDPNYNALEEARIKAAQIRGIPTLKNMYLSSQYQEPSFLAKRWIASFAGHVAKTYKHAARPDKQVIGVKVYRVTHFMVTYRDHASSKDEAGRTVPGRSMFDPTLYVPVYMGEFDADGGMKESCRKRVFQDGKFVDVQRDPFLYWVIPIMPADESQKVPPYDYDILNYVKKHAGDVRDVTPQPQRKRAEHE